MKRILSTIVLLAAAATLAAQTPSPVIHRIFAVNPNIDHTIIRSDKITYYEDNGVGYFGYLNIFGMNCSFVKTPVNWSVRDFRVLDNTVYFCGVDNGLQTALLGHFDLSNLIVGTGNITFYHDANIGSQFTILTRIAIGGGKTDVSIMAIGQTSPAVDPDVSGCNRVLYIENYLAGTGSIYDPEVSSHEKFWDVMATKQYFVMAGSDSLPSQTPNPNIYMHKALIGSSSAIFSTDFRHRSGYNCLLDDISGVRAVALDKDSVVFASYYKFNEYIGMQFITLDAPSGQMEFYQRYSLVNNNLSWPMIAPRDMVYMPSFKSLMVIDDILGYGYLQSNTILMIDPRPDPSLIPIYSYYTPPFFENGQFSKAASLSVDSTVCCLASCDYGSTDGGWTRLDLSSILPFYYNYCINTYQADVFVYPNLAISTLDTGNTNPYRMNLLNDEPKEVFPNDIIPQCGISKDEFGDK